MLPRRSDEKHLFAFSRIERGERIEYLVALNNHRSSTTSAELPTSQRPGAVFKRIFDSQHPDRCGDQTLTANADGRVTVALAPLQFSVWRAEAPLLAPVRAPVVSFVSPKPGAVLTFTSQVIDGQSFPERKELRAELGGGDGFAEVSFLMTRASRPGQFELLGTDDAPPYRIFWNPPPDLSPGDTLSFLAVANDLRGHKSVAKIEGLSVAPHTIAFGIVGAKLPRLVTTPPPSLTRDAGAPLNLTVVAEGTGPLEYQWLRDDEEIPGATAAAYTLARAALGSSGRYTVQVRNRSGTVLSAGCQVNLTAAQ
jgi:hypothetical protein